MTEFMEFSVNFIFSLAWCDLKNYIIMNSGERDRAIIDLFLEHSFVLTLVSSGYIFLLTLSLHRHSSSIRQWCWNCRNNCCFMLYRMLYALLVYAQCWRFYLWFSLSCDLGIISCVCRNQNSMQKSFQFFYSKIGPRNYNYFCGKK